MVRVLVLDEQLAERLREAAARRGTTPEEYALRVLDEDRSSPRRLFP